MFLLQQYICTKKKEVKTPTTTLTNNSKQHYKKTSSYGQADERDTCPSNLITCHLTQTRLVPHTRI